MFVILCDFRTTLHLNLERDSLAYRCMLCNVQKDTWSAIQPNSKIEITCDDADVIFGWTERDSMLMIGRGVAGNHRCRCC